MAIPADAPKLGRKRKRKRLATEKKLTVGERVEVRSEEDGFQGSWHPGSVIACYNQGRRVKYDHLLCNDKSDNLEDVVYVSRSLNGIGSTDANSCNYRGCIRPTPPHVEFNKWVLSYGLCVDVYYQEAWWEGVIFDHDDGSDERRIFFPDLGDELKTGINMLRITQDWSGATDNWQPRGIWSFLKLIEEYEQEGYLGVSVKQIWYDVRGKKGFDEIEEWTCNREDLWKELILEVIDDNLSIILKDVFQVFDHSVSLLQETSGGLKSARTHVDTDTSPESNLDNSHAIVPVEEFCSDPFIDQEKLPVDGLFSALDADEVDMNLLADSDVPCHNKAVSLIAESLPALPPKPGKISSTNLVTIGEELSKVNGKPKGFTRKRNWLPAGPNVLPEPAFCPHAVTEYALLRMKHKKPGSSLATDVRKHLSYLGWKIDFIRYKGENRLRYTSPIGRCYYSLLQICQEMMGSTTETISSFSESQRNFHLSQDDTPSLLLLEQPQANQDPYFCPPQTVASTQSDKLGEKPKFCHRAVVDNDMHGQVKSSKKLKRRKVSRPLPNLNNDLGSICPTRMLLSRKRVQEVVTPRSSHDNPRTVLSWLIDNNVVLPRAKVRYYSRKNHRSLAEGQITRDGIKCSCCEKVFTLYNFEVHAGSKNHRPAASIFLEDGRSLLDCQMQLIRANKLKNFTRKPRVRMKRSSHQGENDSICTVCHYGGELILCDKCPSAFHKSCINLKDVPDGDWFCPSCCCGICGQKKFGGNSEHQVDDIVLTCYQCEHKYHIYCLQNRGADDGMEICPEEKWFCCRKCEQIFLGLQNILGKPIPVGEDNLTWMLLKPMTPDSHDLEALSENYSKLNVALGVMHECFIPMKEPRTRRDLVEDVIFSRESELNRLNFRGFYTVLLERNDEMIAVATVRIYGGKVAEMPLVGTRFRYRRRGMCRILMNELEKETNRLKELEVERLLLPAIPSVLNTWTTSFGFTKMTDVERFQFLDSTFLDFPDTIMCQKLLRKNALTDSRPSRGTQHDLVCGNRDNSDLDLSGAISEVYQSEKVNESRVLGQGLVVVISAPLEIRNFAPDRFFPRTNRYDSNKPVDMVVDQKCLGKTSSSVLA